MYWFKVIRFRIAWWRWFLSDPFAKLTIQLHRDKTITTEERNRQMAAYESREPKLEK